MKRTSFDKSVFKNRNIMLVVLIVLFAFGMIYGALLIKENLSDVLDNLSVITNEYQTMQVKQPILQTFSNSFLISMLFILIPYLFGYSALGQIVSVILPFFYGLGIGCTLGYLYQSYGIKGIGYSALIVIPHSVIALFSMLIACRESVKLSNMFFQSFIPKCDKLAIGNNTTNSKVNFNVVKLYNIKFLVLTAFVAVSAVVHAVTVLLFSNFFR